MSGKRSRKTEDVILIARQTHYQLLSWSLSRKEFYAVCGANSNGVILMAIRVLNRSRRPRHEVEWIWAERQAALKQLHARGLKWAADAHSHPGTAKLEPSEVDFGNSNPGEIEIIVKPETLRMAAWRYAVTYEQTLLNKL